MRRGPGAPLDSKLLGGLVLLGALCGVVFAMEMTYKPESVRALGADSLSGPLITFASVNTPIFLCGSWLLATVPAIGMTRGGYNKKLYTAFSLLSFAVTGVLTVGFYMMRVAFVDFRRGRTQSATLHVVLAAGSVVYVFFCFQVYMVMENNSVSKRAAAVGNYRSIRKARIQKLREFLPEDVEEVIVGADQEDRRANEAGGKDM